MAQVQHLSIRRGVYYYARRVPNEVIGRSAMHQAIFDGKAMYRVSLRTKDRSLALQRFQEEDAKFGAKVALVIGGRVSEPMISGGIGSRGVPRQLTAGILNQVEADWLLHGTNILCSIAFGRRPRRDVTQNASARVSLL